MVTFAFILQSSCVGRHHPVSVRTDWTGSQGGYTLSLVYVAMVLLCFSKTGEFVSGETKGQAIQALKNLGAVLTAAGSSFDKGKL